MDGTKRSTVFRLVLMLCLHAPAFGIPTSCEPVSDPFDPESINTELDLAPGAFCQDLCSALVDCTPELDFLHTVTDQAACFKDCVLFVASAKSPTQDDDFLSGIGCLKNALRESETCCYEVGVQACIVGPLTAPGPPSNNPVGRAAILAVDIDQLGCDSSSCADCGIVLQDPYSKLPRVAGVRESLFSDSSCSVGIVAASQDDFDVQLDPAFVALATAGQDASKQEKSGYYKIADGSCDSPSDDATWLVEWVDLIVEIIVELLTCSVDSSDGCGSKLAGSPCEIHGVDDNAKSKCTALNEDGDDGKKKCFCRKPEGMCAVIATAHSLVALGIVDENWECITTQEGGVTKWHEDFLKLIENKSGDRDGGRGKSKDEVIDMHTDDWNDCWEVEFDVGLGWSAANAAGTDLEDWCNELNERLSHEPAQGKIAEDCYFRVHNGGGHGLKATATQWNPSFLRKDGTRDKCCIITNVETGFQDKPFGSFECTKRNPVTSDYVICEDGKLQIPEYWGAKPWNAMEYGCFKVKLRPGEVWEFLMDEKYQGPGKTKQCGPGSAFEDWKEPSSAPSPIPTPGGPSTNPSSSDVPSVIPTFPPYAARTAVPSSHPTTTPSLPPSDMPMFMTTTTTTTTEAATTTTTATATTTEAITTTMGTATMATITTTEEPAPQETPSSSPTVPPTYHPPASPTAHPVASATDPPSGTPTWTPTTDTSMHPTAHPTTSPSDPPSMHPTWSPTAGTTMDPTMPPTASPSVLPTWSPTVYPTARPTAPPTTEHPTMPPTTSPSVLPTWSPTASPTARPTAPPTSEHSTMPPTASPSVRPTWSPTASPTARPTASGTTEHPVAGDRPPTRPSPPPTTNQPTSSSHWPSTSSVWPTLHFRKRRLSEEDVCPTLAPFYAPTNKPSSASARSDQPSSEPTAACEIGWRQIMWNDFWGEPPSPASSKAHTATGIHHNDAFVVVSEEVYSPLGPRCAVTVRPRELRAFSTMDRCASWLADGGATESALAREQLHFDIGELWARRATNAFFALEVGGVTRAAKGCGLEHLAEAGEKASKRLEKQIIMVLEKKVEKMIEMQVSYDQESNFGEDPVNQEKWRKKISARIANLGSQSQSGSNYKI